MTLQTRLNVGMLAIAVLLVTPLVISLRALRGLEAETVALRNREYAATLLIGRMRSVHDDLTQSTEYLALFPSDDTRRHFLERLSTLAHQTDTLERLSGFVTVYRLRAAVARLSGQAPQAYDLARRGRSTGADSIVDLVMRPALREVERVLFSTELGLEEKTSERVQEFADRTADASYLAMGALGASMLLAFAIALWLSRSIRSPLHELEEGMRAVAEGRYGQPLGISEHRPDEFGRLAASYRSMATQLQELGRLKAEFVSVASHELRTPVNVMLGYLQLLQENVYGELTPRQREICETLTSQTQLLSRLVRQLLDVSRFDAGGGRLDVRPIVLEDFLRDLERAFRVLALQREVNFEVRIEHDIPHEVFWDPERVNEVLGNLLSNAFKFTPRGGRVSVAVVRDGEYVRMQVSDTGAGIPAEQLPYIFEKFYQADAATPTALRGTGLGLAIARSIVTAHGGTISVESQLGTGTCFTILLPTRVIRRTATTAQAGEAA